MVKFANPRLVQAAAGLAALCAFVVIPVTAQAADTAATGTLTAGGLTNTAPAITPFTLTLDGSTHTVTTKVGAWNVTDATGSDAGYSVTVAASDPTVTGAAGATAGTGSTLTLTPTTATAAAGNPTATGPVASGAQLLSTTAATIDNAAATTGQGEWDFAADAGAAANLSIVIPADASAGDYSSTLTFTTAPPVP